MKVEIICLQQCWEKCLGNLHSIILAYKICIKNSHGKINCIQSNTLEYFRSMNPQNLEANKTLNERDINFEVTNISEENLNITPLTNQNLNLSPVLQKSSINSTKSKTKSLPEETCKNQPKASPPTPHKMVPTAQITVNHLVPLKETISSCNNLKYSNISKILIFLFGTSSGINRFDKLRKPLKENKKKGYIQMSYC